MSNPSGQNSKTKEEQLRQFLDALSLSQEKEPQAKEHKFWSTQPVPQAIETQVEHGPIEQDKKPEEVQQEAYPLPKDFEWVTMDITVQEQMQEIYSLLRDHYVEDADSMFRFDYSEDFLRWALQPPEWKKEWHVGVRVSSTKKLVAFISGIPVHLRVYDRTRRMVEINFLCVHKKLRSKRLAPVLIKEVTRRVHLHGIFQAVYTAGVRLPTPFSVCRYYHRSLNPKKLIETGFSHLPPNETIQRVQRRYKLPDHPQLKGFRPMKPSDVPKVCEYLNQYMKRYDVALEFTKEEVEHWLLPREGVVYSYVVRNNEDESTLDAMISFYNLPSSVIGNPEHSHIHAAYLFYYFVNVERKEKDTDAVLADKEDTLLNSLVKDALIMARESHFDVFNCVDILQNAQFVDDLKFGKGDGLLHYYLYNYKCPEIKSGKLGVVML